MSDVGVLIVVAIVYTCLYTAGEIGRKVADRLGWWGLAILLIAPILTIGTGWVVMVLWNLAVPDLFGLPRIDLIPAIALGWLAGILFRGMAPRAVYDVDRERDA